MFIICILDERFQAFIWIILESSIIFHEVSKEFLLSRETVAIHIIQVVLASFFKCNFNNRNCEIALAINLKLHKPFSFTALKSFLNFSALCRVAFFSPCFFLDSVLITTIYFPFPYRHTN